MPNISEKKGYYLGLSGLLLTFVGFSAESLFFFVIGLILLISGIVIYNVKGKKERREIEKKQELSNKRKQELSNIVSLDCFGTLHLKERNPALKEVIRIVEDKTITTGYNPEKLHVGAVSVGGVVSGGAYTTGGNYYVANSQKSGKSKLVYGDNSELIRRIELSNELFEQAKTSPIAAYLDKKTNEIVVIENVYLSQYDYMWINANRAAGNIGTTETEKQGYPSYAKCDTILNWISGNSQATNSAFMAGNSWICSNCGKINYSYNTRCSCGKSRLEV